MGHILFLLIGITIGGLHSGHVERAASGLGFRGRIALTELSDNRVLVEVKTGKVVVADTVRGHALFPVMVNGHLQSFYFGRFGASRYPMLVFGVTDPDRIQDSRVLAYQVAPGGMLIGQQVVVDDAIRHGHTDDVSGGRFELVSIDPLLGAIYSVSYQDARFEGFFVSYEKLRVRQWDPTLNAFIETDQGFLREHNGKLVEATRFYGLNERSRARLFASNVYDLRDHPRVRSVPKPALSARSKRGCRCCIPRCIPSAALLLANRDWNDAQRFSVRRCLERASENDEAYPAVIMWSSVSVRVDTGD